MISLFMIFTFLFDVLIIPHFTRFVKGFLKSFL
nr:MAG TPA: hypothetical protein [Caudoviricetes sp.]